MDTHSAGEWDIHALQGRMLGSEELDALSNQLGIKIPDCVFGNSIVSFQNPASGFIYKFSADKALEMCGFEARTQKLYTEGELKFDHINVIPNEVQVSMASKWAAKTIPRDAAFATPHTPQVPAEICSRGRDWTYSSPYKGTVEGIDGNPIPETVRIAITEEAIPYNMLGIENPILWAHEVIFFEDELDDNGQSKFHIRVRAMQDCFYALIRSYLRVDHVVVRIMDTRVFHKFDERKILREFQMREASYDELRARGFNFPPQWAIDPRESDLIYERLPVIGIFRDEITY
ncbi:unnamed protein product [Blepharisma stoltei]|uniref:TIP41-like protein n=1 Tax=Blepharisma stoltei TaxID=1481888 RepID=A0AAU9JL22_9CILI|nr:unnamed protein product [Blepharisma stoltei]